MALTEAQKRAEKTYKAKLDSIVIRPSKEDGAKIRAMAAAEGKSVNAFIIDKLLNQ